MDNEELQLWQANLSTKLCENLSSDALLYFNGSCISLIDDYITISQQIQTKKIELLSMNFTKAQYIAQRALGAYIVTVSQPRATFALP